MPSWSAFAADHTASLTASPATLQHVTEEVGLETPDCRRAMLPARAKIKLQLMVPVEALAANTELARPMLPDELDNERKKSAHATPREIAGLLGAAGIVFGTQRPLAHVSGEPGTGEKRHMG